MGKNKSGNCRKHLSGIPIKYQLVSGIRVAIDFKTERFGRLVSVAPAFRVSEKGRYRARWFQVYRCDCGNYICTNTEHPRTHNTMSCGCLKQEQLLTRSRIHGMTRTPEFKSLSLAIARCYCPSRPVYKYYGGRGIKVCDRWREPKGQGFINFITDMGMKPSKRHSLDRIDVNGDYCPENCKWSTPLEQGRNKRNNVILTFNGKSMCISQWAEELGMDAPLIAGRIKKGWTAERALTQPLRITKRSKNAKK